MLTSFCLLRKHPAYYMSPASAVSRLQTPTNPDSTRYQQQADRGSITLSHLVVAVAACPACSLLIIYLHLYLALRILHFTLSYEFSFCDLLFQSTLGITGPERVCFSPLRSSRDPTTRWNRSQFS